MRSRSSMRSRALLAIVVSLLFLSAAVAQTDSPNCTISFDSAKLNVCDGTFSLANEDLRHLADVQVFADSGIRVVKFDGPVSRSQRDALLATGAEILGYVPFHGYKVRMDPSLDAAAGAIPGVNWVGPYLPIWKVGINLSNELLDGRLLDGTDDIDSLFVTLQRGAAAGQAQGALEAIPGAHVMTQGRGHDHEYVIVGFARSSLDAIVDAIASDEDVDAVSFRFPEQLMNSQGTWLHQSGEGDPAQWPIFEQGIFGCGQTIGFLDSGLTTTHCSFEDPDPDNDFPFDNCGDGTDCEAVIATDEHRKLGSYMKWVGQAGGPVDYGSGHGTFVLGNALGNNHDDAVDCENLTTPGGITDLDGMAPGARAIMQEAGGSLDYLNDHGGNLYHAATIAYESGARIHNNSWGSSCRNFLGLCIAGCEVEYRPNSRFGDMAVWENPDLLIFAAAGNSGGGDGNTGCGLGADVGSPGNAKSVFGIGGTQRGFNGNDTYMSSSRGPTLDRRTKPDILAQSQGNVSSSVSACGTRSSAGTSFGSPTAAGFGALVREYLQRGFYPLGVETEANAIESPSAALIRAIMTNSAVQITGTGSGGDMPNQNLGWGRLLVDNALYFEGDVRLLWLHDATAGLETGQQDVHTLTVDAGEPLVVTLIWHDYPAELSADPALVNQLRLEVETPGGDVWTQKLTPGGGLADPNPFQATTTTDYDDRNNVHQITLDAPAAGVYTVRVEAIQVAMGDVQPYALAATGALLGIGDPDFVLQPSPTSAAVCAGDDALFDIGVFSVSEFDDPVTLEVTDGLPAGASAGFSVNPVTPADPAAVSVLTISDTGGVAADSYTLQVTGESDGPGFDPITKSVNLALVVDEDLAGPALVAPGDQATDVDLQPEFSWDPVSGAMGYHIQVATDAAFVDIVIDEMLTDTTFTPETELATGTQHFWRVRGDNACGDGEWSAVFEFETRFVPVAEVAPEALAFTLNFGDSDSDELNITNAGTGNLVWSIETDALPTAAGNVRGVDPALDEPFDVGEFTVVSLANDGDSVEFTFTGGTTSLGTVLGVAFEGEVEGVGGTGTWASDLCMIVEAPDGSVVSFGGSSATVPDFPDCNSANTLSWDFQGGGSTDDGFYSSEHPDVFGEGVEDAGTWTITFVHGWNFATAATMNWSDVVVTLLKQPLPVCFEDLADVPWLDVDPASGSVPAGLTDDVTISVDATGLNDGVHEAFLCVTTNDVSAPLIVVPVELTVVDPDAGTLQGVVTGLGYCEADPSPLAGAIVTVEGSQGGVFSTSTGPDGSYAININEGEGPVDVTVSAPGHLDATETGLPIVAGEITEQDFGLMLDAPCAMVEPEAFDETLALGDVEDFPLTISNAAGAAMLEWAVDTAETDCTEPSEIDWLSVAPVSGDTAPGDSSVVDVTVDTTDLADGEYAALICVTTSDDQAGEITAPFTLTVVDPDLGFLEGTVTSLGICGLEPEPLAGALVSVLTSDDNTLETFTDEDGFYSLQIDFNESPVDVTVSAEHHATETETGVVIEAGETTELDFDLAGDSACIEVSPESLEATVDLLQTTDLTLTIDNTGTQPLDWFIDTQRSAFQAVERPSATSAQGAAGDWTPSAEDEAAGIDLSAATRTGGTSVFQGSARGTLLQDGVLLVPQVGNQRVLALDPETGDLLDEDFIDIDGLGTIQHILPHPDGDRLLMTSQTQNVVHSFDVEGEYLGVFAPIGGADNSIMQNIRGMAYHPDTGNLLVTSAGGGNNNAVVEFDLDGNFLGVFIESGSGGLSGPWSLLFRDDDLLLSASGGNIYRYELDGSFIEVWNDDINFPEQISGTEGGDVLAAAFSAPSGAWELDADGNQLAIYGPQTGLRGVHELPGGTILVTNGGGLHEIDRDSNLVRTISAGSSFMFTLAQTLDCTIPEWLSVAPSSGTVAAGGPAAEVTVTFDTAGLSPGVYEGNFCVTSNDPLEPVVQVPVTMTVELPVDFGTIEGTVNSLGYCNADSMPVGGAMVQISGAQQSYMLETDANGFFQTFLPDAESPLSFTVTAPGHLPGQASGVTFSGGDTVVQNFDLLLDAPCATAEPDSISVTLDPDESVSGEITLGNVQGNASLSFNITTATPASPDDRIPPSASLDVVPGGNVSGEQDDLVSTLGQALPGLAVNSVRGGVVDCDNEPGIVIQDNGFIDNGYSANPDVVSRVRFTDYYVPENYPATFRAVCLAFISLGPSSLDFDIVVYADDGPDGQPGTLLGTLAQTATGIPVVAPPIDNLEPVWFSYDISALDATVASGGIYIGVEYTPSAPNVFIASDQDIGNPVGFAGGWWWTNNTAVWEPIQAGYPDYRALFVRPVEDAINCDDPESVPWLNATPAFGSVAAGAARGVDVTINATGMQPGLHEAGLCIATNDPVSPVIVVPVELQVRIPGTYATVQGMVESAGYCGEFPEPLPDATVVIETAMDTYNVAVDGDGFYSILLAPEESPADITVSAPDHVDATETGVSFGESETVTVDFSLEKVLGCTTSIQPSLQATLPSGASETQILELDNTGLMDSEFEVSSIDMGVVTRITLSRDAVPARSVTEADGRFSGTLPAIPASERELERAVRGESIAVLVLSPDGEAGDPIPPTNLVDDLNAFPDIDAQLYTDPLTGLTLADLEPFDAVVLSNNNRWSDANAEVVVGNVLADYVDAGGKVVVNNYTYDFFGWELAGRFMAEDYGPITPATGDIQAATTMVIVAPDSPIFDNVTGVSNDTAVRLTGSTLQPDAELLAEWADGEVMIAINENVMSINVLYSSNGTPGGWTGDLDIIVYNGIVNLVDVEEPEPAPWLSFDPETGTVVAGDSTVIEVTFTALPELPEGTHEAMIVVTLDEGDGETRTLEVPATLVIQEGEVTDIIFEDRFEGADQP